MEEERKPNDYLVRSRTTVDRIVGTGVVATFARVAVAFAVFLPIITTTHFNIETIIGAVMAYTLAFVILPKRVDVDRALNRELFRKVRLIDALGIAVALFFAVRTFLPNASPFMRLALLSMSLVVFSIVWITRNTETSKPS